jgi:3-hydroxyisobutyrate dehydrogenase
MRIGWIGLGSVGLPMAVKTRSAGQIVAYDILGDKINAGEGIQRVNSAREAAKDAEVICIWVFSDDQLYDVLTGPEGILSSLKPGTVVAVFTTGTPDVARDLAQKAPAGVAILDSCFSRTREAAKAGSMLLLIGGEAKAIDKARPVLEAFAREIVHVGPVGAGRTVKYINNVLFAGNLLLAADAMRMAKAEGLDPQTTAGVMTRCSSTSDVMFGFAETSPETMLERAQRYMEKDVGVAFDSLTDAGIDPGRLGVITRPYVDKVKQTI